MFKNKKLIYLSVGLISVTSGSLIGLVLNYTSNLDKHPISTIMKNSIFLSNFIENIGNTNFINTFDFEKSFKLIDENGNPISEGKYSNITVNEAYINNYFQFEVPKNVEFYANRSGIDVFIKKYNENTIKDDFGIYPTYYNSSIPEFKIWFGKGEGKNRVEDFITIYAAGFYGFKKTSEEIDVESVSNIFDENFGLKKDFYIKGTKTIKNGIFAKNIKETDIVSNLTSEELNGVTWNITNLMQDPNISSKLIITVNFSKGVLNQSYYSKTYQKIEINNFNIEYGVDDRVSKVKNFIKDNSNIIGINESFTFKKNNESDTIGTVLDSYKNGLFFLNVPPSFKNKASNAGVEYIFKLYDKIRDNSAFPSEENSKNPEFKVYVRTGFGTPLFYEEFFIVQNVQLENIEFMETTENENINLIKNSNLRNPTLELKNEFIEFNAPIDKIYKIPSNIVSGVQNPEENLSITGPITDASFIPILEIKSMKSNDDNLIITVSISIGVEFVNKSSFEYDFTFQNFIPQKEYNRNLILAFLDAIDTNSSNVSIINKEKITKENELRVIESIKSKKPDNYYFDENVIVGYDDLITKTYKWSQKPSFIIDFTKTTIDVVGNINFYIDIKIDGEFNHIEIKKSIDSFFIK